LGSFTTAAVNWEVPLATIVADPGFTVTLVPGTVMVAEPASELAADEVAVTVTTKSPAGKVVGAV
jgi:hypothetical protein